VSKPVLQRPCADQDIDEIFSHLRRKSPPAAVPFLDSVQETHELLGRQPGLGSPRHAGYCPELPHPLRFLPVRRFPRILVYYMERADAIEVIRVWDAARGLETLMEELE
jgi:toxin ParE1/3/4